MSKLAETEIRQARRRTGTQRARKRKKAFMSRATVTDIRPLTCWDGVERDGNRTRTISLGIGRITARRAADQPVSRTWNVRD
jgi:hypothetical protein